MQYIKPRRNSETNTIRFIRENIGKQITLHGHIYRIRQMRGFAFVLLRTADTVVQCVYGTFSQFALSELTEEAAVVFTANVVKEARAQIGAELQLVQVQVLSVPAEEPPVVIHNKEIVASLETLLDYRTLTLRNPKERAIFSLQAGICRGIRSFFDTQGFTEIHSPKIVFSGAEGGANIFSVPYFERHAYLTQSPQFYKQMMVGVFERVYEIGPVFRAEKHDTSRHLNEYTSVDMEMGFIDSFVDIMEMQTAMLRDVFAFLQSAYCDALQLMEIELPKIEQIPTIKFAEAKELICKTYQRQITDMLDFEPEEERLLYEWIYKQTGSDFVYVTHYPSAKRPFYAMDDPANAEETLSFDLLYKGMEIATGGQRIHSYTEQVEKMQKRNMHVADFESYLMAHKYGLPPHGGFGLGLERLTALLTGHSNVRQATLFPRDTKRLTP